VRDLATNRRLALSVVSYDEPRYATVEKLPFYLLLPSALRPGGSTPVSP